jgi:hypothetical protein
MWCIEPLTKYIGQCLTTESALILLLLIRVYSVYYSICTYFFLVTEFFLC